MILYTLISPRHIFKSLVIFTLAVILYMIVYQNEFSINRDEPRLEPLGRDVYELMKYSSRVEKVPQVFGQVYSQGPLNEEDTIESLTRPSNSFEQTETNRNYEENQSMKYILIWTPTVTPFKKIRKRGQVIFIANNCKHTNCYLTHKRDFFQDQTKFDAIVFSIAALSKIQNLPRNRSLKQKFIASSIEPPQNHPVVSPQFDGYFNWTWTYRLNSDILWRQFLIYNRHDMEVGPKKDIKWLTKFSSLIFELEKQLYWKRNSVVWIKRSCKPNNVNNLLQLKYIFELESELKTKRLSLAIYSNCSINNRCGSMDKCAELIREQFYFYLAFEEYFDEDYVTNILIFAVQNFAVPIVYGGADYSRFLPPGSYLDANSLTASEMAVVIDNSMSNFTVFLQYFKWLSHYYYQSAGLESEVCNLCTALNNKDMVKKTTVYKEFRKMWNGETVLSFSNFAMEAFQSDNSLKEMLKNKSYKDIRDRFMKKFNLEPEESVYIFDIEKLNITSTEGTFYMPDELRTESTINLEL